jgi:enoyl-CoA hydratase/carnithine racemase
VRDRTGQDAESLGFASLVVSNVNLLPRLKKLPMSYRLANKAFLRQLKVLLKAASRRCQDAESLDKSRSVWIREDS